MRGEAGWQESRSWWAAVEQAVVCASAAVSASSVEAVLEDGAPTEERFVDFELAWSKQ